MRCVLFVVCWFCVVCCLWLGCFCLFGDVVVVRCVLCVGCCLLCGVACCLLLFLVFVVCRFVVCVVVLCCS